MNKAPKKLIAYLLAMVLALSLAACGGSTTSTSNTPEADNSAEGSSVATDSTAETNADQEPVTLTMYTDYTEESVIAETDYAMEKMKEVMPHVTLKIEPAAQDSNAKLKTMMATGNLTDIFGIPVSEMETAVKGDLLEPLDPYIEKLDLKSKLTPSVMGYLDQIDGHTWIMPYENATFGLVYANKTLFEEHGVKIPENYDELLEAGKAFADKGITAIGIWLKEDWPPLQLYDMLVLPEAPDGIKALDVNGTAMPSDPAYLNAATKLIEMVNAGMISKDAFTMDYDSAMAQFNTGKAAMMICGSWQAQAFGDEMGEDNVLILGNEIFADPDKAVATKAACPMSGGGFNGGMSVSAGSPNAEVAAEYCVQFQLDLLEGRIVKSGETNTTLLSAPEPEVAPNMVTKQLIDMASNAQSTTIMGWAFNDAKIQTNFAAEVQKLFAGQSTAEQFAESADNVIATERGE
jgi:raffinose/stachyose/melibiose transport system substrate-binding protein